MILSLKNFKEKYEQQKEFINIAAHEIRGPSHAIMGYVDLLHEDPLDNKRYLESITRNAERLNLLISNILDVSRIDNKMTILKKEKIDLINLINQIIEDQIDQISQQKRIDIHVNLVTTYDIMENSTATAADIQEMNHNTKHNKKNIMLVNADKLRLAQVISNLLDNALKFTTKGGITITIRESNLPPPLIDKVAPIEEDIRLSDKARNKQQVIVEVKDSGKGIDSIILPKVFSKFSSDPNVGGTGLGLYISKNIIEAHGGKIWAKNNEDGKGSTFSFSLPKIDNEISNGE
jgi:signal transduction histidine kinase